MLQTNIFVLHIYWTFGVKMREREKDGLICGYFKTSAKSNAFSTHGFLSHCGTVEGGNASIMPDTKKEKKKKTTTKTKKNKNY